MEGVCKIYIAYINLSNEELYLSIVFKESANYLGLKLHSGFFTSGKLHSLGKCVLAVLFSL